MLDELQVMSYEDGYYAGVKAAIAICECRAGLDGKSGSTRNEASKCASQISWRLLETDPCPYCDGSGCVYVNVDHEQSMSCQWCSATGRVKKGKPLIQEEIEAGAEYEAKADPDAHHDDAEPKDRFHAVELDTKKIEAKGSIPDALS